MTKKMKSKSNVYINNFILYGLNRNRNFLSAPICEECDCGEKMHIILKEEEELYNFMSAMLLEHECPESALFAVGQGNQFYAAIKTYDEEEDEPAIQICKSDDMHMFAKLDGDLRLCCYGLIIEDAPGEWMIQE